jgi:hypothetical protein
MKPVARLMKLLTDRMPRKTAFASVTMTATLIVFAIVFFVLGGAHDDALEQNASLKKSLDQTTRNAKQAKEDRQFVIENQTKYEELLNSDRLVPHTRRVALDKLEFLKKQDGLTSVNYNFAAAGQRSAASAASQPVTGGYKVQVETVELKIGAPLDTSVFDFLLDLGEKFPGSAVVETFAIERAAEITTDALNQVSQNREAGLVKGEVHLTWRTAQKEEDPAKAQAVAKGAK